MVLGVLGLLEEDVVEEVSDDIEDFLTLGLEVDTVVVDDMTLLELQQQYTNIVEYIALGELIPRLQLILLQKPHPILRPQHSQYINIKIRPSQTIQIELRIKELILNQSKYINIPIVHIFDNVLHLLVVLDLATIGE